MPEVTVTCPHFDAGVCLGGFFDPRIGHDLPLLPAALIEEQISELEKRIRIRFLRADQAKNQG